MKASSVRRRTFLAGMLGTGLANGMLGNVALGDPETPRLKRDSFPCSMGERSRAGTPMPNGSSTAPAGSGKSNPEQSPASRTRLATAAC